MPGWKTLELPKKGDDTDFEIELDLENDDNENESGSAVETSDDEESQEQKTQESSDEQDDEQSEASQEEEQKEEVKSDRRKRTGKTRAKRRIEAQQRALKEKDDAIVALNKRLEALEQGSTTANLDSKITTLEDKARRLGSEVAAANKEGEYEKAATLQAELTDVLVDVKVLKAQKTAAPKSSDKRQPKEDESSNYQNAPQELPEAFLDWQDENPWFEEPETRDERRLARYIRKQGSRLTQEEGFEPDDDDLYEELQELAAKFVADKGLDVEGFEKPKKVEKTTKRAPVSENHRDSGVKKKGKRITVKLTEDEQRIARRFGMTNEEYAKSKIAQDQKTKTGWTTVFNG